MATKVLITGGFGFIGTALVAHLLHKDVCDIHVVDDLSTSPIDIPDFLNGLPSRTRLTYEIGQLHSVLDPSFDGQWEAIYHLASPVGPAGILNHAGEIIRTVVRDGYAVCDYALRNRIRIVDVSTSEIYGGGKDGLCVETTPKLIQANTTVRLEYAIAKLAVETAIFNLCKVRNLDAIIVRPFNVAGPRQSPKGGFVLPRFIQQADNGADITVFGQGDAVRAFTHVEDMAEGIRLAMIKGQSGTAYNLGNPENKTTIIKLASLVKELLNSSSAITHVDPKELYGPLYEEASDKYPDAQKAFSELGWAPSRSIRETIIDAWKEYKRQLASGVLKDSVA